MNISPLRRKFRLLAVIRLLRRKLISLRLKIQAFNTKIEAIEIESPPCDREQEHDLERDRVDDQAVADLRKAFPYVARPHDPVVIGESGDVGSKDGAHGLGEASRGALEADQH